MATKYLFNGKMQSANAIANNTGISRYNVLKVLESVNVNDGEDVSPFITNDSVEIISKRTIGGKYELFGKYLTRKQIASKVGSSYALVTLQLLSADAKPGDNVETIFGEKFKAKNKLYFKEINALGFLFMGNAFSAAMIANTLGLSRENVATRISKVYPYEERVKRYLSGNENPIDVTDLFCWTTATATTGGVQYFGKRATSSVYELDGLPFSLIQAANHLGISESYFKSNFSSSFRI